jgi:hypothetical protein
VDVTVVFWSPEVVVGEHVTFQVTLSAPSTVALSVLPIALMELVFSGANRSIRVQHTGDVGKLETVRKFDLGHVDMHGSGEDSQVGDTSAYLRWRPDDVLVLCGTISSNVTCSLTVCLISSMASQDRGSMMDMQVSKLVLTLKENTWVVEIPFESPGIRTGVHPPRWLSGLNPSAFIPVRGADVSTLRWVLDKLAAAFLI